MGAFFYPTAPHTYTQREEKHVDCESGLYQHLISWQFVYISQVYNTEFVGIAHFGGTDSRDKESAIFPIFRLYRCRLIGTLTKTS